MSLSDINIHIDAAPITGLLIPIDKPRICVIHNSQSPAIHLQEFLGAIPVPLPGNTLELPNVNNERNCESGVVILPIEGGGRGPVINEGQVISTSLLLELLGSALSETEFTDEFNARLDDMKSSLITDVQNGYVTHDETIIMDFDYSNRLPKLDLIYSHGLVRKSSETVFEGITYVTIADQEIIYGHSGLINNNQFTVKAAILEYAVPTVVSLNWTPADVIGPPITALTTESPITNTTANCMGLRIKGTLGIVNTAASKVSGTMSLQMLVDGGPWIKIVELYKIFEVNDNTLVEKNFDILLAYDQAAHTYKFRGQLVVDSDIDPTRQLTGAVHIDTVTESGSGTILSNDLQIKWTAKE